MEVLVTLVVIVVLLVAGLGLWALAIERKELAKDPDEHSVRSTAGSVGYAAGALIAKAKRPYVQSQAKMQVEASLVKYQALEKLKALLDDGAISDDEFSTEKKKLFGS